jgi:tetratricopeptide (TPR) repeat protein
MDIIKKLKSMLQEAELYRNQGLLNESQSKYDAAIKLAQTHPDLARHPNILAGIKKKMAMLTEHIQKVESADQTPEVDGRVQDLIKKLFAFPAESNDDATALEGALALAKFGQYSRAIEEFNQLIEKDTLQVVAAKNIVKCYIAQSAADEAVSQFEKWAAGSSFSSDQLEKIRIFANNVFEKENIPQRLERPKTTGAAGQAADDQAGDHIDEEDILDINSIGLTLTSGSGQGKSVELNVSFQSGNVISLLISSSEKELLQFLEVGVKLDDIQFYSPIAMFNGSGEVSGKSMIESGPRKGDYNLDIKVITT